MKVIKGIVDLNPKSSPKKVCVSPFFVFKNSSRANVLVQFKNLCSFVCLFCCFTSLVNS